MSGVGLIEDKEFSRFIDEFTKGTLLKNLLKNSESSADSLRKFASIASEISQHEANAEDYGDYAEATWVALHAEDPDRVESGLTTIFGLPGLLYALRAKRQRTEAITYRSIHRLPIKTIKSFSSRTKWLHISSGSALFTGAVCLVWSVVLFIESTDYMTPPENKWLLAVSVPLMIIAFLAAAWCESERIPKKLRVYSGGKFQLSSLRTINPQQ